MTTTFDTIEISVLSSNFAGWFWEIMYHKMSSFINSEIPCPICLQLYVEKNKSAEGQGKVLSFILTVKSL